MGGLDIKEEMDVMYRQILDTYNGEIDPTGLLLFVLDNVIYHSAWLKKCGPRAWPSFLFNPFAKHPRTTQEITSKGGT